MKKPISAVATMAFLLLGFSFAVAAELPPVPPLPKKFKSIQIAKPDPSVPKEIAAFLGEWEGAWKYVGPMGRQLSFGQESRRAKFIIYEVSSDKIKFLYGIAESPHHPGKEGWRKLETDIREEGGKTRFSFVGGWRMGFYLEMGVLIGSSGGEYELEMKRVK